MQNLSDLVGNLLATYDNSVVPEQEYEQNCRALREWYEQVKRLAEIVLEKDTAHSCGLPCSCQPVSYPLSKEKPKTHADYCPIGFAEQILEDTMLWL